MGSYIWTDDANDPCSLCVQWTDVDSQDSMEDATPYMPDGPVNRVYRATHFECKMAVQRMQDDYDQRGEF